jgi:uncharacterized iron-regulated membrane protein
MSVAVHHISVFRRRMLSAAWQLHRWIGLTFGLILVSISITGTLLVVHDQLESTFESAAHVVAPRSDVRAPLTSVVQKLAAEHPEVRPTLVAFEDQDPGRAWSIYFRNDENRELRYRATANPYTGEVLSYRHQDKGTLTGLLLQLHFTLFLGRWGTWLTALTAVSLFLTSLAGFYIYRNALRDMWRIPFRRINGSRHIARDLHRWVGTWALLFNLLAGATGTWFMVLVIQNRFFETPAAKKAAVYDVAKLPDLDRIVADARQQYPAAELLNVALPQRANGKITVSFLHRDAAVWHKFSRVSYDAKTGARIQIADAQTQPFLVKLRSILSPLHFGFYGAKWVQVLYFFGGLTPGLLSISGFIVWRTRHSRALADAAIHRSPAATASRLNAADAARAPAEAAQLP